MEWKSVIRRAGRSAAEPAGRLVNRGRDRRRPGDWGLVVGTDGVLQLHGHPLPDLTSRFGSPLRVIDTDRRRRTLETAGGDRAVVVRSRHELEIALSQGSASSDIVALSTTDADDFGRRAADAGVVVVCVDGASSWWTRAPEIEGVTGVWHRGPRARTESTRTALGRLRADDPERAVDLVIDTGVVVVDGRSVEAARRVATEVLSALDGPLGSIVVRIETSPTTGHRIPSWSRRLNQTFGVDVVGPPRDAMGPIDALRALRHSLDARRLGARSLRFDPGGGLSADSEFLLATVVDVDESGEVGYVVLDAGINLADDTLQRYQHLLNASRPTRVEGRRSASTHRVVGPICTPADVLYAHWRFDAVEVGDVLAIMDTGTGQSTSSTAFSFTRPAVLAVDGTGSCGVVRRRESFDDLLALDLRVGPTVLGTSEQSG